jgi:hypothetical protein
MTTNRNHKKTRRLAGHNVTLTAGEWYIASRPMATRGRTTYPITIRDAHGNEVLTIANLSYDEANTLLAAFNTDGPISFNGRTW